MECRYRKPPAAGGLRSSWGAGTGESGLSRRGRGERAVCGVGGELSASLGGHPAGWAPSSGVGRGALGAAGWDLGSLSQGGCPGWGRKAEELRWQRGAQPFWGEVCWGVQPSQTPWCSAGAGAGMLRVLRAPPRDGSQPRTLHPPLLQRLRGHP